MLFPTLKPSSLSVVVAQPDERHANGNAYERVLEINFGGFCRSLALMVVFLLNY